MVKLIQLSTINRHRKSARTREKGSTPGQVAPIHIIPIVGKICHQLFVLCPIVDKVISCLSIYPAGVSVKR